MMTETRRIRPVAMLAPIVAAGAVFVVPLDIEPAGRRALAIATWMVAAWIVESFHPAVVGFAGCFLFVAAQCAQFDIAFGGFGTSTPWFLCGALMLVAAARASGAIRRLAAVVPSGVTSSFVTAAATVVCLALVAGQAIDSAIARAVIVVVVALAISGRLDEALAVSSRLPLVAVASYAAAILGGEAPGSAPSIVWRLVSVAICIVVAARFVRPATASQQASEPETELAAGRVLVLLGVVVLAWATTRVHGVSPGIIGLGAGIAAAFPGLRAGEKGPQADPLALMLAGAALSVPLVLEETKAAAALTAALGSWMAGYWEQLVMALFDPRVDGFAPKLALYQSPALILGAAAGGFTTREVLKFGVPLALAGAIATLAM